MSPSPLRLIADARVRVAWQEQVAAVRTTPGLALILLRQRQALPPRFAASYTQLRSLPRRVRRALQRQWKLSLAGVALLLALGQEPVLAAMKHLHTIWKDLTSCNSLYTCFLRYW